MKSLNHVIDTIVDQSILLKNKYLSDFDTEMDYVAIFTQDNEEYDYYAEEALKIGKLFKEDNECIYVILNESIESDIGNFNLIKIGKPDTSKKAIGYSDLRIDYKKLKAEIVDNSAFNITTSNDGIELVELKDNAFNVLIYFPEIPLSTEINQTSANASKSMNEAALQNNQLEEEKQRRLQLMADFENYKRRVEQEKALFGAMANMSLIQDILEVYDDLELAIQDNDLDLDRAKSSIKNAQSKMSTTVLKAGIEKIDVKIGDDFDKEKMEAISTIPDEKNKGKVIVVISSAYKYTGKDGILKAAKVIVGK
jgi:molecular chaperone GrpE